MWRQLCPPFDYDSPPHVRAASRQTFIALGRPVHPTRVIGRRSATSFHAKRIEIALNIR
jgi:hypothetical protein